MTATDNDQLTENKKLLKNLGSAIAMATDRHSMPMNDRIETARFVLMQLLTKSAPSKEMSEAAANASIAFIKQANITEAKDIFSVEFLAAIRNLIGDDVVDYRANMKIQTIEDIFAHLDTALGTLIAYDAAEIVKAIWNDDEIVNGAALSKNLRVQGEIVNGSAAGYTVSLTLKMERTNAGEQEFAEFARTLQ